MALRQILKDGDETLRKNSRPVGEFDAKLQALIDDMFDTMYDGQGIGLAAPQVGILKRLFVMDLQDGTPPVVAINPVINACEGSQIGQEGCLSIPGKYGDVERPASLVLEAYDRFGQPFSLPATGLRAVCICHETDHLDGILFRDKVKGPLLSE
ncbi:MAG: peptide deformylase [Eubacteriales bacterium]|nr:peptide deformylase [Eubacteriales bacterium]